MRTLVRGLVLFIAALVFVVAGTGTASAATFNITWLDMSPTPFGSSVPNNSTFFMPGVGNVIVTYNVPSDFTHSRTFNACLQNGTLTPGADTYSWVNHELFATIFTDGPDPLVPRQWDITYTFPGVLPAGTVYVGVAGLGSTTSFGGGESKATVNQNGFFLGDWTGTGSGCGPWGPTQFTAGFGTFNMKNSQTGPGGQDPWWNTPLGVVKIMDAVSSVTVFFDQLRGDGVGVNIGHADAATPTKATSWGRVKNLYR